ncbi:MAG: erythromycin biosynthesis sensory transduction protein eryC1 [Myxococcales bacterium]|nr:erythromycin biosynthesis sensory transduction protein eryC1 [Myxococcales bacterium]
MIRMADLAARHARVAAEVEPAVLAVLRSGRYVGGPVVDAAMAGVAKHFGWGHAVGVNSGTDALIYALQAVGVRPGDEVVVPAVTFFASAGAVCRIGAVPIIADVRPDLPLLDPAALPITARTRAVMAVHLYGERCDLPALSVPIVDDAAQVAGADPACRTGEIAAVSFYPTKTLGAAGDGGCVLTDSPGVARKLHLLTHHGMPTPYVAEAIDGVVGANSRLDAIQAAVLHAHLGDLTARVAARRAHAQTYDQELPASVERIPRWSGHPVHQYVLLLPPGVDRDAVAARMRAQAIETAVYYPRSLSAQPALAAFARPTPRADAFCARCLALPVHEGLGEQEVCKVIDGLTQALAQTVREPRRA